MAIRAICQPGMPPTTTVCRREMGGYPARFGPITGAPCSRAPRQARPGLGLEQTRPRLRPSVSVRVLLAAERDHIVAASVQPVAAG